MHKVFAWNLDKNIAHTLRLFIKPSAASFRKVGWHRHYLQCCSSLCTEGCASDKAIVLEYSWLLDNKQYCINKYMNNTR